MRTLIDFFAPDAGDGRGAPQVALGEAAPSPLGAHITVARYPDRGRPGRIWTCLFAELSFAAKPVLEAAPQATARWPVVAVIAGKQTVWDGITVLHGAKAAATKSGLAVSWVEDGSGVHACVMSERFDADPDDLLEPFRELGLLSGWALEKGQERRWALANLGIVAPDVDPPESAAVEELRAGLAHLCGYPTVPAMLSSGRYDPTPHVGRSGNVEFKRVRHLRGPAELKSVSLVYQTSTAAGVGGLIDVLRSGMLLSQRRRRVMGVRGSAHDDRANVEAGYSPLITFDVDTSGRAPAVGFVWSDAVRLLRRLDFGVIPVVPIKPGFAGGRDVVGAVEHDRTCRSIVDGEGRFAPEAAEVDSLDLYGPHGPDWVVVRDHQEQIAALRVMQELGVMEVGGKPLSQAVVVVGRGVERGGVPAQQRA